MEVIIATQDHLFKKLMPLHVAMDSYAFCANILDGILCNVMDISDEMELVFLKGHLSPLPLEQLGEANVAPTMASDDEQADAFDDGCSSHCTMKAILFEKIAEIETLSSETNKVHEYLHTCTDLLAAIDEIQKRLAALVE